MQFSCLHGVCVLGLLLCQGRSFKKFFGHKVLQVWNQSLNHTVDGNNPANQLKLVVYPIIYKVFFYISAGAGFLNHQQYLSALKIWISHVQQLLAIQEVQAGGCWFFRSLESLLIYIPGKSKKWDHEHHFKTIKNPEIGKTLPTQDFHIVLCHFSHLLYMFFFKVELHK